MDFDQMMNRMRSSVVGSKRGHLVLGWRVRLWLEMNRAFNDPSFRRHVLLYLTLDSMLPHWGEHAVSEECPAEWRAQLLPQPARIVALLRRMLAENSPVAQEIAERSRLMLGLHDHVAPFLRTRTIADVSSAFSAAFQHVENLDDRMYAEEWYSIVADDTRIETIDDLTSDYEPEGFDSYFFASQVAAFEGTGGELEDAQARRRFWLKWIDDWLPQVLGTTEDVMRRTS